VSISEPFIRRPVATSLLMAGVVLLGILGYKLLPISALPTVDFPNDRSDDILSRSERRRNGLVDHYAARAAVWANQRIGVDEFHQLVWHIDHYFAVRAGPPDRRCGAGRASRDQCRRRISAAKSAEPAEIQQGQSGRHTDPHAFHHVRQFAARSRERFRRHVARAEI